ncbi:hypothetical protein FSARC_12278 [Fusarium sarcochroum]|uniref:2EXR domain-containing protein n=1 Tax=Fusarium sarcochroum TaxID=1208366 RepID=A0A8H4WXV4_9HYPO|nr:hypothetical protein FSARC_12278 [Fusarium sarcochroum]
MSGRDVRPSFASQMIDAILAPFTKLGPLIPKINFTSELTLTNPEGSQLLRLRAEVGPPAIQAATTYLVSPGFPQFKNLPPEIRVIIWKLSFGPPRVFRTKATSTVSGVVPMVVNHKPPPATQACKEARDISLKVGKFLFGSYGGETKSLWFNLSKDIVYWDRTKLRWTQIHHNSHELSCVKNVAVDLRKDVASCFDEAHDVSVIFPRCKRFLVVLQHKALADSDVRFFYVNDNDHIAFECVGRHRLWEEVEMDLGDCYNELYKDDETLFLDEFDMPRFYAVEVTPIRTRTQD